MTKKLSDLSVKANGSTVTITCRDNKTLFELSEKILGAKKFIDHVEIDYVNIKLIKQKIKEIFNQ